MVDYKKADQACKMLEESGTTYVLAYNNDSQNVVNCAFGRYPLLKNFIVHVMAELADILCRNYGEEKNDCRITRNDVSSRGIIL